MTLTPSEEDEEEKQETQEESEVEEEEEELPVKLNQGYALTPGNLFLHLFIRQCFYPPILPFFTQIFDPP